MSVFRRLRKCGERKKEINKLSAKYNGSLALATLERATMTVLPQYSIGSYVCFVICVETVKHITKLFTPPIVESRHSMFFTPNSIKHRGGFTFNKGVKRTDLKIRYKILQKSNMKSHTIYRTC